MALLFWRRWKCESLHSDRHTVSWAHKKKSSLELSAQVSLKGLRKCENECTIFAYSFPWVLNLSDSHGENQPDSIQ